MKRFCTFVVLLIAAALVTVAWGGHEIPIYPSFYPHEIEIRPLARERAAGALLKGDIHAYLGAAPDFASPLPDSISMVESLGSFILVRINPQSPLAKDKDSTCSVARRVVREIAAKPGDIIFHPYPVTPLHGDYLHHADLAEAAKAQYTDTGSAAQLSDTSVLKIRTSDRLARSHPDWSARDADWDAEVLEIDAAEFITSAMFAINGWLAPPWVKTGWFHAERLLAGGIVDPARKQAVESDMRRLSTSDFGDIAERINLERDLVTSLTAECRDTVAGYTVKHEYFNAEYSAGIENVGYDAITGLQSPMFIRTVKLKDFPWNGWLALGIDAEPKAAWNPIAGMTDQFGRLMWFAVGDPALIPSPYEAGWMLNRIADIPRNLPQ